MPGRQLEEILEVLHGIGATLMVISAKLDDVIVLLGGEDDERPNA